MTGVAYVVRCSVVGTEVSNVCACGSADPDVVTGGAGTYCYMYSAGWCDVASAPELGGKGSYKSGDASVGEAAAER